MGSKGAAVAARVAAARPQGRRRRLAYAARRMGAARPGSGGADGQPGQDRHRPFADGAGRDRRAGRTLGQWPRRLVGDAAQAQSGVQHDRAGRRRRTPQHAAALLACMDQQHERGLGNWQAELAEWPPLFLSAHGALRALNDAFAGLTVDRERMRAEYRRAAGPRVRRSAVELPGRRHRPARRACAAGSLTRRVTSEGRHLAPCCAMPSRRSAALPPTSTCSSSPALFDPVAAAEPARRLAGASWKAAQPHGGTGRHPPFSRKADTHEFRSA
jgi:hypothetical protein